MTSLSEVVRGSWDKGLNAMKYAVSKGTFLVKLQRRTASDFLGSMMVRNWDKVPGGYATTIDPVALPEVLRIYHDFCDVASDGFFDRYSRIFRQVFYVAKFNAEIVGYSTYYVKPSLTLCGLRKRAVLYSMAVDAEHRRQGIGKHLLTVSILEMQINGIDEIVLYVSKKNIPALSLYTKLGFVAIGELPDICKEGESCYEMRLGLPAALA